MENRGDRITSVFDHFARPLPRPEAEANKFLGDLKHLSQQEVRDLLKIIIDQAGESRKYGLYLNGKLLEKEERFFLTILDSLGGISTIVNGHRFEDVERAISDMESAYFEPELREFYAKFSKKKDGAKTTYNAHLSSVRGAVLNAVFNKPA
jgi:hypothetical protein